MSAEKELRLALVCFGGVSLAVYMHGVTKEVLKLVRASRRYHDAEVDGDLPLDSPERDYAVPPAGHGDIPDTEAVYFDLLRQIGHKLELRVIVDVIAGASAGGVNGILLGRALAHDLAYEPLRTMWLERADVEELLEPAHRARQRSKWFLRPLFWLFRRSQIARITRDPEVRRKLSLFVRSRWFRPPFSGRILSGLLLDALAGMGRAERRRGSLLPQQQTLDLFVTVTDFFGYAHKIALHDPPYITEREHRHVFRFQYRRTASGIVSSDFGDDAIPALAFAGRATSSFPGAFPPARLREMDRLIADRGGTWPGRYVFAARNFAPYLRGQGTLDTSVFIDGSVLNNKPFAEALTAIRDRPAYRQVDRRLVYIDPDPDRNLKPQTRRTPGFFTTLKAAMSDIPRAEPIHDELQFVLSFNARIGQLKAALEGARPRITRLVDDIVGNGLDQRPELADINRWRVATNERAANEAGFAYQGYVHLKLNAVIGELANLLLTTVRDPDLDATPIVNAITTWAAERGVFTADQGERAGEASPTGSPWADFLVSYDVQYRSRRLRFVIRELNLLYGLLDTPDFAGTTTKQLDDVKAALYDALETLRRFRTVAFLNEDALAQVSAIDWRVPYREQSGQVDDVLASIAGGIDLRAFNQQVDRVFGVMIGEQLAPPARRALLRAYLGFAFWDVVAFTMTGWQSLGEYDEIRVDRISPEDANSLRPGGAREILKGIGLQHFAAFFSRAHRENDYLWGRLHAAERLIDIVCDAAGANAPDGATVHALKMAAFGSILAAERPHLSQNQALIDELTADVATASAGSMSERQALG